MASSGRILGIDFGKRRIGIAVSDPTHTIAQGLPTISHDSVAGAIQGILALVEQFEVSKVVVGLPLTLKGERGQAVEQTEMFVKALKQTLSQPVELIDERFTSVIAQRTLQEFGISPSKDKPTIDKISATLILQHYLDKRSGEAE